MKKLEDPWSRELAVLPSIPPMTDFCQKVKEVLRALLVKDIFCLF